LSALNKKLVYADGTLSQLLGVSVGTMVSYADITKGVHRYIKQNDLKNPNRAQLAQPTQTAAPEMAAQTPPTQEVSTKACRDCGAQIPVAAAYCDMCGVAQ